MRVLSEARSILPGAARHSEEERLESPGSLRWRIVAVVGVAALVLLGTLSWLGSAGLTSLMGAQADSRLLEAARRSSLLVEALLLERQRQLTMLSGSPAVVDAALAGARRSRELGLPALSLEQLEERFASRRSLDVDVRVRRHLQEVLSSLDIAEVMVTDENGFNVVTTARTTDFVQSDEAWWQEAFREGHWGPAAEHDESAGQAVIASAIAVRERFGDPPLGVVKASFGLTRMDSALARASRIGGIQVDLIDRQGTVIASSSETPRLRPIPGAESLAAAGNDSLITYVSPEAPRRAAIIPVNGGRWRLVTHMDERVAAAPLDRARAILYGTAATLFLLMLVVLVWISHSITRRVSDPAARLAAATEAVAAGDLSIEIAATAADDEIGRLTRATRGMISDLHRMATALRRSATGTAGMAAEITIGTEHMSGAAQQTAEMANDLSRQSSEMAETVQALAGDAGQLVTVAAELDAGAHEGLERNARMRVLARENRERFTESSEALAQLAGESRASIAAAQALGEASEEIRAFVTFVQKMARQSKLLALNAAMEAARAGDRGHGFAVVAGEVRRLAAGAAQAAERTEQLVGGVLARAQESRESSSRAAETVERVLEATQAGHASFEQVEQAVIDNEAWTAQIERAARSSNDLVVEMTNRVQQLAHGTESFAAAMQEVAASSEEQSASIEQISGAAHKLSQEAGKLSGLVATFKLERIEKESSAAVDGSTAAPGSSRSEVESARSSVVSRQLSLT